MRNSKKKVGLIALFAGLLTGAIAFAAATRILTISGEAGITTRPMAVYFAVDDNVYDDPGAANREITSAGTFPTTGEAEPALKKGTATGSTITLSGNTTRIEGLEIGLNEEGDFVLWTLAVKNTGTEDAYLKSLSIEGFESEVDKIGWSTSGVLQVGLYFKSGLSVNSFGGKAVTTIPSSDFVLKAGEVATFTLYSEWRSSEYGAGGAGAEKPPVVDANGDGQADEYTITIGTISMVWEDTPLVTT